jgi:hypothetical protein
VVKSAASGAAKALESATKSVAGGLTGVAIN